MTEKRLSHAYMLVGPDDPARGEAATRLAAGMLCSAQDAPCGRCRDCRKVFSGVHPDVITVERLPGDKGQLRKDILVDQIRDVTADAAVAPNEAERKVYIIREADRLNIAAQNALLKALEDPPGHACFILCTAAADALLPTVRSRCVRADDTRRAGTLRELSPLAAEYLRLAGAGNAADVTLFCMLRAKLSREETDELLTEISGALCDILCSRRPAEGLTPARALALDRRIAQMREYLERNISARQIFGLLAAETLR